jgi:aspergillopepsin I
LFQSSAEVDKMLSTISAVLGLAVTIQAAPAPAPASEVVRRSTFSAPAVHNANFVRNGTAALLKAYAKHHLIPTKEMPEAFLNELLAKRQDGSATAVPSGGVEVCKLTMVIRCFKEPGIGTCL